MSDNLVELVAARLSQSLPSLEQRVLGVLELAEGIERTLPRLPGAFVLPLGYRPARPSTGSTEHRQQVSWRLGVMLVDGVADDQAGSRSLGSMQELINGGLAALAGWSPALETWSPLEAGPGDLVSVEGGVVAFQLSFITESELRT